MVVAELIFDSKKYGERIALRDRRRVIRFDEIEAEIARFDRLIRKKPEGPGFVFGALLTNRIEYPLAYLAALYFGYPLVPVDYRLPLHAIEYILKDAGIAVLLVDSETSAKAAELKGLCRILNVDDPFLRERSRGAKSHAKASSIGSINYTSGTTGQPKGVMLSQRNHLASCVNFLQNVEELEHIRHILHVLPFSHSTVSLLLPAVSNGICTTVCECAGARNVMNAFDRYRPDATLMHPALLYELLDIVRQDPGQGEKLRSIQTVFYGSSPISPQRLREANEVFGRIFIQVYGMTETLPPVALLRKEDHARALENSRCRLLASCGRIARGVEVKIVDELEREVEENRPGEILVRGGNVTEGYLGRKEETERFLRGGWAHTGDRAYRKEGYLFIVDRKNDIIIRGGHDIYPLEVENIISGIEGVRECAVFAVPDKKEGEVPFCAIVTDRGRDVDTGTWKRALEKNLPCEKIPVRFIMMKNLPRNINGKINRMALREPYRQGMERKTH